MINVQFINKIHQAIMCVCVCVCVCVCARVHVCVENGNQNLFNHVIYFMHGNSIHMFTEVKWYTKSLLSTQTLSDKGIAIYKSIPEVPEQEVTNPLVPPRPLQEEAAQGTVQVALILECLAQL